MGVVRKTLWSIVAVALALVGLTLVPGRASAATGDIGYGDQTFANAVKPPTSDKPESKLWYVNGQWWAVMWLDSGTSGSWHIMRLNRATEQWVDTGVIVDSRSNTLTDAMWDGNKLYIASHVVTLSNDNVTHPSVAGKAFLYRYSYSSSANTFALDSGFPTLIVNQTSESMAIDEDSQGNIWATWTQVSAVANTNPVQYTNQVYVNETTGSNGVWGQPLAVPIAGSNPSPDDISAIVAFHGHVGVLWGNQNTFNTYWAMHTDGQPLASSWVGGPITNGSSSNPLADDHVNIKSLQSSATGQVFAVFKTSLDHTYPLTDTTHAQILVASYTLGSTTWNTQTFGTIADCHTRPQLMLDNQNSMVYVLATGPSGTGPCPFSGATGAIYEKAAAMSTLAFPSGRGTPIIQDGSNLGTATGMNNVTTSKQMVNNSTGLVALAATDTSSTGVPARYWHADLTLGTATAPVARFTASPTSGKAPLAVQFTDTSTGSPTSWSWDFGDGGTSPAQSPSHTFQTAGTYTVRLTVTNSKGSSSTTQTITAAATPVASFTASPGTGASSLTVAFTDTSTNGPTSWAWDFGDNSTSPVQNPSHTYAAAGTYTVTLTASNSAGSSAPASQSVTVAAPVVKPVASFTASPTSGTAPLAVQFTDTSTGTPTQWSWNFGDGTAASTAQSPSHTFQSAGTYQVTLTATNSAGSSTATKTITVNPAPVANFTASPTSGTAPLTVQFTDTSTGSPTSWSWDFGDGGTSTLKNPAHTFQSANTYQVKLTATNASGSYTSQPQTITVRTASTLAAGQVLSSGQWLISSNGQYGVVMQGDGNLVIYSAGGTAVWASGTGGTAGAQLQLRTDGALVIVDSGGTLVAQAPVSGGSGASVVMEDSGNLVLHRADGSVAWETISGDHLAAGQVLSNGQSLTSSNGQYAVVMQGDGNLVIYSAGGTAVWASGTGGTAGAQLQLRTDGTLVIVDSGGTVVAQAPASGGSGASVVMEDSGNLVLHRADGSVAWSSAL